MLEPTTRALFVDAFRPPTGHHVDLAIGTTYTLGLRMLFLPPLAMAAHDREAQLLDDDAEETPSRHVDTLALLESVRRYADRTTVYCHAAAIGAPGRYPRLLSLAEDSLIQVLPRHDGFIFHPKVWALRFRQDDTVTHRLIVSSRNLSDDTSWDTLLVLDQGQDGRGIPGVPAADFIRALPSLAVGHVADDRPGQAADLASTLADAWFEVPEPFTGGELRPSGLTPDRSFTWPMPDSPARAVVISPFLDAAAVGRVRAQQTPVLVSRPETYKLVGSRAVEHTTVKVLSPYAEHELEDATPEDDPQPDADHKRTSTTRLNQREVRTGLHAKILVWDQGRTGHAFVGSANATTAAFTGNVEFNVLLTGPRARCGVEALLPPGKPSRERVTFAHVLEDHSIPDPDPQDDPTLELERAVGIHHEAILRAGPTLTCEALDDEGYAVSLTFAEPLPDGPGTTMLRLISQEASHRREPGRAQWSPVRLLEITPYLELCTTVTLPETGTDLEIVSVVKAELLGAPEERAAQVLRSYLASQDSIVRYLRFLLDDADLGSVGDVLERDLHNETETLRSPGAPASPFEDLAIMEPLLRAAANGSEALDRVQALLRDLGVGPDQPGEFPEEFLQLWQAVWDATQEARR